MHTHLHNYMSCAYMHTHLFTVYMYTNIHISMYTYVYKCSRIYMHSMRANLRYAATYINTLQHAATHCNMQSCSVLQCVAVR